MKVTTKEGWLINLDRVDYDDALEMQSNMEARRKAGEIPDVLILLEHDPVYTLGRSTNPDNLLLDPEDLKKRGIKIREIRRGGDITFHGPGQLVGYPVIDLREHRKDVHWYLRNLEEVIIGSLKEFNLECYTIKGMTGVWCEGRKIAAIGVGISKWVTTHGFALNVNNDLDYFSGIVPCGLQGKQVTSMKTMLQKTQNMEDVKTVISNKFSNLFTISFKSHSQDNFLHPR